MSPKLEATRTQNWRPTKTEPSSFNRQIMYDKRPDGSMMPIMNPNGEVVRRKEFGERRHEIESTIRRIRNTEPDIVGGS